MRLRFFESVETLLNASNQGHHGFIWSACRKVINPLIHLSELLAQVTHVILHSVDSQLQGRKLQRRHPSHKWDHKQEQAHLDTR
jgi:hypothetical protein